MPATSRDDEPGPSNDSSSDHGGTEETNTNSLHTQEAVAGDLVQASEDAPPSKKRKRLFQRSWLAGRESWLRYDEERCATFCILGTSIGK